jgi:hypothetical protein
MKIVLLVLLGVVGVALLAYFLLFPRNSFFSFYRPSGRIITFSQTGVSFQPAPDHYATNGFDHLEPYVSRLLIPAKRLKFLHIFTPDGNRGFGLSARDGRIEAGLNVEWRQDAKREAAIRSFFTSLGIAPSRDYLAGNGGVPDATRILEDPVAGNSKDVSNLTRRILQELCGVSPAEALDVRYFEK